MGNDSRLRLAKDILSFYIEHPNTTESTEGLARWRLLAHYVDKTLHETDVAVTWLVTEGYLQAVFGTGNHRLFALNEARRRDAELLLADGTEDPNGWS
jgi:hypothetical protein